MKFKSILEWQKATLEQAAAEQNTDVIELLTDLLKEWACDDYWGFIEEKAEKYNYILEEQEEE